MDSVFSIDTALILDFDYRIPVGARQPRMILVPSYMYRVLCPSPTDKALNPFQRAVIHFISIGVTTADKMAEGIHLAPDLIQLILTELQGMGIIAKDGQLTPKGKEASQVEDGISSKPEPMYVFQNPWSGVLFPRVKAHLKEALVEYASDGDLMIQRGTHGDPKAYKPHLLAAYYVSQEPPTPRQILRAAQQHQRASRSYDDYDVDEKDDLHAETHITPLPPGMERVKNISPVAQPVYLLTSIYVREWENAWYVSDPFGVGTSSPWLYQALDSQRSRDEKLREWLKRYEGTLTSKETSPREEDARTHAEDELEKAFPQSFLEHEYYEEILYFEMRRYEVGSQGIPTAYDDLIVQLAKIVERALQDMLKKYPCSIKYPNVDRAFRKTLLDQWAAQAGFTVPIPDYYLGIDPVKIKDTAYRHQGTIAEMFIVAMMSAAQSELHPLRDVAQQQTGLLGNLEKLARDRNQSAHTSKQHFDEKTVETHRTHVFAFISALIEAKRT